MVDQNQPEYVANPKAPCDLSITRTTLYLSPVNLSSKTYKTTYYRKRLVGNVVVKSQRRATADVPLHRGAGWIFEIDHLKRFESPRNINLKPD